MSKKCAASSCGAPNPSSRDTCYYCGGPLEEVKKAPPLKVILPVAFILIVIVIIAGTALKPIIARSRVPDTGPIKVSASDLCADYRENESAAYDKYEITGGSCVIAIDDALKRLMAGQKVRIWGCCCGFDIYRQGNVVVIENYKLQK